MISTSIKDRPRQRRKIITAASKKKSPRSQRGYKATRNKQDVLRISLLEGPPLWIAPELGGGGGPQGWDMAGTK